MRRASSGSASDLERIASFGFRGEALPSIASVSRFRLVTRLKDAPEACEIRAAGGIVEEPRSLGAPFGTHIEVADLFAQVPARRKFLKKPSTEWGHIADWLARLALVLPAVHFEIRRDDRAPQVWPATQNVLDRIAAVLSEEEASAPHRSDGNNSRRRTTRVYLRPRLDPSKHQQHSPVRQRAPGPGPAYSPCATPILQGLASSRSLPERLALPLG